MGYDQALFVQMLRAKAKENVVTYADLEECFWRVCMELSQALYEQKPMVTAVALTKYFMANLAPGLAATIERDTNLTVNKPGDST